MKQKIVVKVSMSDQKSRKKALKIAVCQTGVDSVALTGEDKNQIEVVGEGIDVAGLTTLLRKNVGYANLLIVTPTDEENDAGGGGGGQNEETTENRNQATIQQPIIWTSNAYAYPQYLQTYYYENTDQSNYPYCKIM